jgi:hypothetical protein
LYILLKQNGPDTLQYHVRPKSTRQAQKCCDSKVRRSSNKPGQARTVAKAAGSDSAALQVPTARHCPARLTVHFPGKLAYPAQAYSSSSSDDEALGDRFNCRQSLSVSLSHTIVSLPHTLAHTHSLSHTLIEAPTHKLIESPTHPLAD